MTVSTGVNARSYQLVDVDSDDLVPDDAAGVLDMRPVGSLPRAYMSSSSAPLAALGDQS
jgi:hypothetical protein